MKLGLSLGALAALQLAAGMVLQLTLLALLGAGSATDAWVASQAVPLVAFAIVAVAFQGAWQSRLAVSAHQHEAWVLTQRTAQGQLLLACGTTLLVLIPTAGYWVHWLFPGLSDEQLALAARMSQLLLIGALLNSQALLLTTALRSRGRFLVPEAIALITSIGAILLAVALVPRFGIESAAWISLARSLVVTAILFGLASAPLPHIGEALRDAQAWRQVRPLLMGAMVYKSGPLVDRFWSSLAPMGGMTVFNLVQMGMSAVATVLERSVCMPVTPTLARLAERQDYLSMRRVYRRAIVHTAIVAAATLLVLAAAQPLWTTLAAPFKLGDDAARQAWWLCVVLVGYLVPATAGTVVASSFYALGDTRLPANVGTLGFLLAIALKALAFLAWGLTGLAVAMVAHYGGNMLVLCWVLERRLARLWRDHGTDRQSS